MLLSCEDNCWIAGGTSEDAGRSDAGFQAPALAPRITQAAEEDTPYFVRECWEKRNTFGELLFHLEHWAISNFRKAFQLFRSCSYKWGMASSVVCERGAEEQAVDYVVLQCPIHRPPHGLHGLTVLDDETIEWLLNTCPEI